MKLPMTGRRVMRVGALLLLGSMSYGCALAADEICTFQSTESHYANTASPGEPLLVKWRKSTGKVLDIQWLHGGVGWYEFASQPGMIVPEAFPGDYHLRVNLGMTTAGFDAYRYEVRGYINTNVSLPSATFAGVFEGSGSAWFVAYGTLTCVRVP